MKTAKIMSRMKKPLVTTGLMLGLGLCAITTASAVSIPSGEALAVMPIGGYETSTKAPDKTAPLAIMPEAAAEAILPEVNLPETDPTELLPVVPTPAQPAEPLIAWVKPGTTALNIRSGPGLVYEVLGQTQGGVKLEALEEQDGWVAISYEESYAYVSADYVSVMTQADYDNRLANASTQGEAIVLAAYDYLGVPYVYGGNGPNSFDCSGFVKYMYAQFGVDLNRTATDQLENGYAVELQEVIPGDLVFFRSPGTVKPVSHVGMYIGDGQFIHASTNDYSVRVDNLFEGYYTDIYVYARRLF